MPRAWATPATWRPAAAGLISGSRPLPEAVTKSTGTWRGLVPGLLSTKFFSRNLTASISALFVGPRFEPLELAHVPRDAVAASAGCGPRPADARQRTREAGRARGGRRKGLH